jgi:hypothetical protein
MEKPSEETLETRPRPSWWIWIGALEYASTARFVYGCAARCFGKARWTYRSEHEIPGTGRIIIQQRTVTEDTFQVFRGALDAGLIKPELLLGEAFPETAIAVTRHLIQEALGQTAAKATIYYTLPELSDLIGDDENAIQGLLSRLQHELNLPFTSSYASRLGNFEIFDLHDWLDRSQPFLIEVASRSGKDLVGPETLHIARAPEFAGQRHLARVMGRVHGDVVLDRVMVLEPGLLRTPVESPERLDQLDFQIFSAAGETLLHSEHNSFMNRINLVLAPIHQQITVEDEVSARATQRGLGSQAMSVLRHSSIRSSVGGPAKGSWRKFAEDMDDAVAARLPKPSEDKWFPRGIEGEVSAIAHLNHLLDGGQVRRAVLVDPWFGVDALRRFAIRLQSLDLLLTIVTSWTRIDPDTGVLLEFTTSPTEKLEAALRQLQPILHPRLAVINLADGNRQAFHDRYLLLYCHEGPSKVFLLSNSLNNAAGDWPFAMSLLAPDVGLEVRRYIEGLCSGKDIARAKALSITLTWPPNA